MLHRPHPRFAGFGGVGGPDHGETGNGAQPGQLLDGLVRRTVLTHADAVVRKHEERFQLHERGQPQRRLHVIREDEERGAEGKNAAMRRHAVHSRAHRVFADAEGNVASAVAPYTADRALRAGPAQFRRLEIAQSFERGVGGRVQIGRTADEVGNPLG